MSKEKNKKAEVVAEVKPVKPAGPTAGLKPVSCGLQPVISPKGQVQLAPIVVPVAFAPYGTQNQPMLQYEKEKKAAAEITDQPLDNSVAPDAKRKKKNAKVVAIYDEDEIKSSKKGKKDKAAAPKKGAVRSAAVAAIAMCILYLVPGILTYIAPDLALMGGTVEGLGFPNPIRTVMAGDFSNIAGLVNLVAFGLAAINLVLAIVALITGKNLKLGIFGVLVFLATIAGGYLYGVAKLVIFSGEGSGYARMLILGLVLMIVELMCRVKKVKVDSEGKPKKEKKSKKVKEEEAFA